jgi:hypothetical protein
MPAWEALRADFYHFNFYEYNRNTVMTLSKKLPPLSKFKEKRDGLLKQVQAAQKRLEELENKRKLEVGALAIEAGLADMDDALLKAAFEKIAGSHEQNRTST